MALIVGDINQYIIPDNFSLGDAYPNPFNPSTGIPLSMNKDSHVKAMIYNINGQLVETILDTQMLAGNHMIYWNSSNHASGIYFLQIIIDGQHVQHEKIVLLK